MRGGNGNSQTCGSFGDGGEADGGDEVAFFCEGGGGDEGGFVGTEDFRDDGAGVARAEESGIGNQFFAEDFSFGGADEIKGCEGGVGEGWGRRSAIYKRPGAVCDESYPIAAGG